MARNIALLRGINVGGRTSIKMAELRELCAELGWEQVETYIQSGNLIFAAKGGATSLETKLEQAVERRFGIDVPVLVRSAAQWQALVAANPLREAAEAEPNRLMLSLSKHPLAAGAAAAIQERARDGEQIREAGGALWIHYPEGAGTSKLAPSLLERLAGSPVTARNWRTVVKLAELAGA
jgi:uncharacterized protein (DUF1697 family)